MRLKPFRAIPRSAWLKATRKAGRSDREAIRQWLLLELTETYSYPSKWLKQRLQLANGGDQKRFPKEFFGFALLTSKGDPFLLASIVPGNAARAEKRLRDLLRAEPFTRLGLSTDGTAEGTRILRQRSNSEECDYVPDLETFFYSEGQHLLGPFRAPGGNGHPGRDLEPISDSLEDVFFQAHSHVRDIDGLHADEALDELCKILYVKLFDEEMTVPGEPYSLQRGVYGTVEECAATIRRMYHDANEYDVRVFSLKIPGYDRSRGVFGTPIRLSSPALVKVLQGIEPYWLNKSSIDVKGRAFQRVLGPAVRAGMGQYFTPLEVIHFMVDVVEPAVTDLVLDPFSGSGHFLTQSLDSVRTRTKKADEKRVDEFAYNKLHGIEKSDRMFRVAMTDKRLHGDGHSNIRCTDALLDFQNYPDLRPESFDVVTTNPPFGCLLGPEAIARLGKFTLASSKKNLPLEVLGLERCIQFLRPGGRLGIVLPDGLLANRNADYVRRWLVDHVKIRAVVSLPVETFTPFGANIKTSILFARKWKSGEKRVNDYHVHLSKIDNVGYDSTGRQHAGSELPEAAARIREFLHAEGW
jgi:type I restriction enzyme M protein